MAGCKVGKVAFSLLVLWCLGSLISGCTAASAVAIPGGRRLTAGGLAPAFWNSSSTEVGRVTGRELVDFEVKMNGSNFSEKVLSAQPPLADEDLGPLLKLRSAWNIAPSFWNDSLNPCGPSAWPGVRCSVVDNHQRVAFLTNPYLAFGDGRVLTGTIPDAIGDLSALEGVSLDSTRLTGKLPDSIGRLLNLKSLVITRSNLTGPLPFAIRTCVNLTEVDLTGNQLSGPITPGGQPLGLQILIVRDNYLTGEIPEELFGRLKQPIMVSLAVSLSDLLLVSSRSCFLREWPSKSPRMLSSLMMWC